MQTLGWWYDYKKSDIMQCMYSDVIMYLSIAQQLRSNTIDSDQASNDDEGESIQDDSEYQHA